MRRYAIISLSSRALAASAKRGGYAVHSLDCHADSDTRTDAVSAQRLAYGDNGFDQQALTAAVDRLLAEDPAICFVAGSGFERNPAQLDLIRRRGALLANTSESLGRLNDPAGFKRLLDKHGIRHPATWAGFSQPRPDSLVKRIGAEGGAHVRRAGAALPAGPGHYYQEFIEGEVMSAVLLASGAGVIALGFNRQWQTAGLPGRPFMYAGAITLSRVDIAIRRAVARIAAVLVAELGLRGLLGLDFIRRGSGQIIVLELNPRPPATFELHEHGRALFRRHIACFEQGAACFRPAPIAGTRGHAVLYLARDIDRFPALTWPAWARDRPVAGTTVPAGAPVCSVAARAPAKEAVRRLLKARLRQIKALIRAHPRINKRTSK